MALELDDRQRAMLLEMGVRAWLPGTAFAVALEGAATTPEGAAAATTQPATHRAPPVAAAAPGFAPSAPGMATAAPVRVPVQPQIAPPVRQPPSQQDGAVPDVSALPWSELQQAAAACAACALCAGRKHTTLQAPADAQGWSGRADWLVVGDPPDEEEDASGSPFAGASGVLLANMLKAIGVTRINDDGAAARSALAPANSAYVSNVVKCHGPHGAVPQAADLSQCSAYLQREIALVQPKMILAMGRFANQLLLSENPELVNQPLGKVRGTVYRYRGVPVVVTYHPKILIRNSADKAKAWADLCLAADTLDALVPDPRA